MHFYFIKQHFCIFDYYNENFLLSLSRESWTSNHCSCGFDETLTHTCERAFHNKCVITNHLLSVCCSHSQEVVHESRLKPAGHRNPFILWKPSLQICLRRPSRDTAAGQANIIKDWKEHRAAFRVKRWILNIINRTVSRQQFCLGMTDFSI